MANETVLVLGGGPAGCAAASLLARWGHRVVLRTKRTPASPALIESIPPSTRKLFETIGLQSTIEAAGFLRSTGNTVCWETDSPRVELFPDASRGWQAARATLEQHLLTHARNSGVRVEQLRGGPTDGDAHAWAFTLDCTGRTGVLARRLGLRVSEPAGRTVAIAAIWSRGAEFALPEPTHTVIESYDGGWAWSVPEALDRRIVAVMVDPATSGLARGLPARDIYLHQLQRTSWMRSLVNDADAIEGPSGWDASMYYATDPVAERVLLVGDAASFVDPISSIGIKKALASGWLAAVAVNTCLQHPSMQNVALTFYAARETEMYRSLRTLTAQVFAAAAVARPHPFWSDRADLQSHDLESHALLDDRERVAAAFERLRREPGLQVRRAPDARVEPRPAVCGSEIVLESRLVRDDAERGVRYAYDVDLVGLVELAPRFSSVPELLEAYNGHYAPVALPDFLAALSTALAQKWLVWV